VEPVVPGQQDQAVVSLGAQEHQEAVLPGQRAAAEGSVGCWVEDVTETEEQAPAQAAAARDFWGV
jgi:hypothetical protein